MQIRCTRLSSPPDDQTEETLVSISCWEDCSPILDVSLHVLLLAVITVSSRGGRWGIPIAMGSFSLRVTLGGQGGGPTSSQWIRNVPTRIPVP